MKYIEVKGFADFDILYTICIMVSFDNVKTREEILKDFFEIEGINDTHGNDYRKLYDLTQNFISYLELIGFKRLETETIYFCD